MNGQDPRKSLPEVYRLGYMTRPAGLVFDPESQDTIIVGEKDNASNLFLDDFVCALRSLFIFGAYPQLTIDPEGKAADAKWQSVKMTRGIEDSHFGRVFFESDYLLKKISLGLVKAKPRGFKSQYRLMIERRVKKAATCRFWFKPFGVDILVFGNAVYLNRYPVWVLSEPLDPYCSEEEAQTAVKFAQSFSLSYDEFSKDYPVFEDLRNLLRWVGIAGSISSLDFSPDLRFWLQDYEVRKVMIPGKVKSLSNMYGDLNLILRVCGGVESAFLNLRSRLKDNLPPLNFAASVIKCRPDKDALTWEIPFEEKITAVKSEEEVFKIEKLFLEGRSLFSRKEYKKAIKNFDIIIENLPDFPAAWFMKGDALHELGKYEEAIICYDEALKINPKDTDALVNKSDALLKLKKYRQALQCAQDALKINPKDKTAWDNQQEALGHL